MPRDEAAPTVFVDRASGRLVEERIFGGSALSKLYGTPGARAFTSAVLARPSVNRLYGLWQRGPWSKKRIDGFVRNLGIDAGEAELPLSAYPSLDAFFTRRLRPEARPIDTDPARLVSPVDGRVLVYPRIEGELPQVKGARVTLDDLLGDARRASLYDGGAAFVFRLAPADYHRIHFPSDGTAGAPRALAGPLHSVHPIALENGAPSFRNQRVTTRIDTARFGSLTMVDVGALCVGTIVQTYAPGPVTRGDEKGYFRFGGSTVVLLVPRERVVIDADLRNASERGTEVLVRMGTGIATAVP